MSNDQPHAGPGAPADPATFAFDAVPVGLVVVRSDGTVAEVNDEALRLSGRSRHGVIARPLTDAAPRAIRVDGSPWDPRQRPMLVTLRTGVRVDGAIIGLPRGDGSLVWLRVSSAPMTLPDGDRGAVMTLTDVTDLFLEKQATSTFFYAHSPLPTWVVDAERFDIVDLNPAFTVWLGRTPEELVGADHLVIVHPDDRRLVVDIRADVSPWEHRRTQLRFLHADGSIVHAITMAITVVEPRNGRTKVVLVAVDNTEHVAALAKLTAVNRRFRAIFERATSGAMILDLRASARIIATNPAAARVLRWDTPSQHAMALFAELVHPSERDTMLAALDALALGAATEQVVVSRFSRRDGDVICGVSLVALPDHDGHATTALAQLEAFHSPERE